jgi:hypothetical protein
MHWVVSTSVDAPLSSSVAEKRITRANVMHQRGIEPHSRLVKSMSMYFIRVCSIHNRCPFESRWVRNLFLPLVWQGTKSSKSSHAPAGNRTPSEYGQR